MKVYSVFTEREEILDTFSYEEALLAQKEHQGAMINEQEIDVLPGETAKEAADRAGEQSFEEFKERNKQAIDRLATILEMMSRK